MKKIVISADNSGDRKVISSFLARSDIKFIIPEIDVSLTDIISQQRPDLVLLLIRKGEDKEISLLSEIKAKKDISKIPLIVIGPPDEKTQDRCLEHGIEGYLKIPIDKFNLRRSVFSILGLQTRQAARVQVSIPCSIYYKGSILSGTVADISTGGLFVKFQDRLKSLNPGDNIKCSFEVDNHGSFSIWCKVIRPIKNLDISGIETIGAAALRFLNADEETVHRIEKVVAERLFGKEIKEAREIETVSDYDITKILGILDRIAKGKEILEDVKFEADYINLDEIRQEMKIMYPWEIDLFTKNKIYHPALGKEKIAVLREKDKWIRFLVAFRIKLKAFYHHYNRHSVMEDRLESEFVKRSKELLLESTRIFNDFKAFKHLHRTKVGRMGTDELHTSWFSCFKYILKIREVYYVFKSDSDPEFFKDFLKPQDYYHIKKPLHKHYVKKKDSNILELSEEEYRKIKRSLIVKIILLIILIPLILYIVLNKPYISSVAEEVVYEREPQKAYLVDPSDLDTEVPIQFSVIRDNVFVGIVKDGWLEIDRNLKKQQVLRLYNKLKPEGIRIIRLFDNENNPLLSVEDGRVIFFDEFNREVNHEAKDSNESK